MGVYCREFWSSCPSPPPPPPEKMLASPLGVTIVSAIAKHELTRNLLCSKRKANNIYFATKIWHGAVTFLSIITYISLNRCKSYETKLYLALRTILSRVCQILAQNAINYLLTITGTPIRIFLWWYRVNKRLYLLGNSWVTSQYLKHFKNWPNKQTLAPSPNPLVKIPVETSSTGGNWSY